MFCFEDIKSVKYNYQLLQDEKQKLEQIVDYLLKKNEEEENSIQPDHNPTH